jgi:hypothetical protein
MKKTFFLIIIFLVVLVGFLVKSPFLNAQVVTVKIANASCLTEDSLKQSLRLEGEKVLLINQLEVQTKVEKNFQCVKNVVIKKMIPNKVELDVSGRVPVAVIDFVPLPTMNNLPQLDDDILEATPSSQSAVILKDPEEDISTASSSGKFLVDGEGLAYSNDTAGVTLPEFIYSDQSLEVGQKIDQSALLQSLQIVSQLKNWSIINTSPPLIFGNSLRFESQSYGIIHFGLDKDLTPELASLQLILRAGTMNSGSNSGEQASQEIRSIDLRFNKPVVVYSKKK